MARRKATENSRRLRNGVVILAGLNSLTPVPKELPADEFRRVQQKLADAQRKLAAADRRCAAAAKTATACAATVNRAVDKVVHGLGFDDGDAASIFSAAVSMSPSALKSLPLAERAAAVATLVGAAQSRSNAGKATLAACTEAARAAKLLAKALPEIDASQQAATELAHARNVIDQEWDAIVRDLRTVCKLLALRGMAQVGAAIFPAARATKTKAKTPADPEVNAAAIPATPTEATAAPAKAAPGA